MTFIRVPMALATGLLLVLGSTVARAQPAQPAEEEPAAAEASDDQRHEAEAEGVEATSEPADEPSAADPEPSPSPKAEAQAKVDKANKLAKIQRYDQAILLVEDAYLVLEDPELLRILGEYHAAKGDVPKALRSFDAYLEDLQVGETAKASARKRRAELAASLKGDKERKDGDGDEDDELLGGEWQFSKLGGGTPGRLYVTLGGRISHLDGPSYETVAGGSGPEANSTVSGEWIHGGLGPLLEVGGYLREDLSLGLELSNQWMNWEVRSAADVFETTLVGGHRPTAAGILRYFFGLGFYGGLALGGDMVVFSEPITRPTCATGGQCAPVEIEDGVQGYRAFGGLNLGYRTDLAEDFLIGTDVGWRYVPVFATTNLALDELPSYSDPSWLLELGFAVTYNP